MNNLRGELYSARVLIFIESEPQSNEYHQLMLNKEEFKKISMNIGKIVDQNGEDQMVQFDETIETYTLPDLPQIYN